MTRRLTETERYEIAGKLRFASEHYAQEAAAIFLLPSNGIAPSTVEQKMISERVAQAARCRELAEIAMGASS